MRENKEETPLFPIRQELDEFSDYLQRKLVEDNEKEMEIILNDFRTNQPF